MIKIENAFVGYDKKIILKNINCNFEKGNITTIIGPNGSGKSTLLKAITRQINLSEGEIFLNGKSIIEYSPKDYAKKVAYLKQSRDIPAITAEAFVIHGRFPYMGFPRKITDEDKVIAKKAMQMVGVFDLKDRELCELSGGERQKVYLAMTLTQNAEILLMDEPTTYLDIKHQLEFLKILKELKKQGKTIITVLHDINSALKISDYICVLKKGEIFFSGHPSELIKTNIIENVFEVEAKKLITEENNFIFNFKI